MKELTQNWSYEIIDDETIIYKGTGDNIDFSEPLVLSNCYVTNAFSLQMLKELNTTVKITEVKQSDFEKIAPTIKSVIGHPDTARILGLQYNRENIKLEKGEILLVAQLTGGRLPEGATKLPKGFQFTYLLIEILLTNSNGFQNGG